jgi:hypothetical protein
MTDLSTYTAILTLPSRRITSYVSGKGGIEIVRAIGARRARRPAVAELAPA